MSKKREESEEYDCEFTLEDFSTDPFFNDPNVIFAHQYEAMKMYLRCDSDEDQE